MHYSDYISSRPVYRITDDEEGIEFYATRGATVLDAFMAYMSVGLAEEHVWEWYSRLAEAIDAGEHDRIRQAIGAIPDIRVYAFNDDSGEYEEIVYVLPGEEGEDHE
jgi:hypothetical protein